MKMVAFGGMRSLLAAFLLASVSALLPAIVAAAPAAADSTEVETLTAADRLKIREVITLQIRAMERNEAAKAFSYSTPETRQYFGSSRAFMEMVRDGYTVLFKNTSREFLEAAVIDGQVIQPLRIVARDGEALVALYTLERQPDQEWRIGSCELAPSTLQAT